MAGTTTGLIRAIGLMSGTSLDGVDAALVETDGHTIARRGRSLTLPYAPDFVGRMRDLLDWAPRLAADSPDILAAAAALTRVHAEAVAALGEPADVIGFHGQTILHRPAERRTWQLGDAAWLAAATGLPVMHDFRTADVAAGGQGAPFAPLIHAALADGLEQPLAVLNLGGVGNATWIGADGTLLACDTGPANGPLDDLAQRHLGTLRDEGGRLALAGRADPAILARLMADPYFARPAPKSLDRLDFAARLAASGIAGLAPADAAATLVAFAAEAVCRAPFPQPPRRWLVTGGGRHNAALMAALRERLPRVEPVEAVGWDGDVLEAQCFGLLAVRVLRGLPLSFPGTTGVPRPMPGGRISRPPAPSSDAP